MDEIRIIKAILGVNDDAEVEYVDSNVLQIVHAHLPDIPIVAYGTEPYSEEPPTIEHHVMMVKPIRVQYGHIIVTTSAGVCSCGKVFIKKRM